MRLWGLLSFCLLLVLYTCTCIQATENKEDELDHARDTFVGSAKAHTFLRVKRGWRFRVRFRRVKRIWGEERREESRRRENNREATHRAWIQSHCAQRCWTTWTSYSSCTHPCGQRGFKVRTRKKVATPANHACAHWMRTNNCPGENEDRKPCNRYCANGGTPSGNGCKCRPGYLGGCCRHVVTCRPLGRPSDGRSSLSSRAPHRHGVKATFSCNKGFRMIGSQTLVCQTNGKWNGDPPRCRIISCANPGGLANGKVQGIDYRYRKHLVYTCDTGYQLTGLVQRICQSNGAWSGKAPTCSAVKCPKLTAPSGGTVNVPSTPEYRNTAVYSCRNGYHHLGSKSRTCLASGSWSGSHPTCTRIVCPLPPGVVNGHVHMLQIPTLYGHKINITCNRGYKLSGSARRVCSASGPIGVWTGTTASCNAISCGNPGVPIHSVKYGSQYTVHQSVVYTCQPGYYLSGTTKITCQTNARWTAQKPSCIACPLNTFTQRSSSSTRCNTCPSHSHTTSTASNHVIKCLCNHGFRGRPGGPCNEVRCATPVLPKNSRMFSCDNKVSKPCRFTCVSGHIVTQGDLSLTCQSDGRWSGSPPVCSACPRNTYKNGPKTCSNCPTNSYTRGPGSIKAECLCKKGFIGPLGGPCVDINECLVRNGGCMQKCQNLPGSYECVCNIPGYAVNPKNNKMCKVTRKCPDFPTPDNGGAICSHIHTNRRCQVRCNEGYEHMMKPVPYEQCGPNTNWQWTFNITGEEITPCLEEFFPGVQNELEIFYFSSDCESLTVPMKMNIRRSFVTMLRNRGICTQNGRDVCSIDEIRIVCGKMQDFSIPYFRGRRAASSVYNNTNVMDIKFQIHVPESASKLVNCTRSCSRTIIARQRCRNICSTLYTYQSMSRVRSASQSLKLLLRNGGYLNLTSSLLLKIGQRSFYPVTTFMKVSKVQLVCSQGTISVQNSTKCLGCPAGSFANQTSCVPCPVKTYQPNHLQTQCLPCPRSLRKGSRRC